MTENEQSLEVAPLGPMTFEQARDQTADDLRRVAGLLNERADAVAKGDMVVMDKLLDEEWREWYELLLIRYSYREERRNGC